MRGRRSFGRRSFKKSFGHSRKRVRRGSKRIKKYGVSVEEYACNQEGGKMRCTSPVRLRHLSPSLYPDGLLVPCGKCLACRIAKRTEWAMRMLHELSDYEDAVFVTLTYDEDHIPSNHSLKKSDLQKWFKRVRKEIEPKKIRYFACGEYGDKTQRPHYHAIIFGLSLRVDDKMVMQSKWPMGRLHYGTAEPDSIRYVAQYIDKKYTGDFAKREYAEKHREPVFRVSSLGLGRSYINKNSDQIKRMGHCTVRGVLHSLPRYYLNKLGVDPQLYRDEAYFKQCEEYEEATGLNLHPDIAYRVRPAAEVTKYQKAVDKSKAKIRKSSSQSCSLKK